MSQVEKKDVAWLVNGAKPLTLNAPGLVSDSFTWETVETLRAKIKEFVDPNFEVK